MNSFLKIWRLQSPGGRLKASGLIAMMAFGALLELAGLGMVMPLIAVLAEPALLEQNKFLRVVSHVVAPASDSQFILCMCAIVAALYLAKNVYLLFLSRLQARFVYKRAAELGSRLFEMYLKAPYSFHLKRNSSTFLANLNMIPMISGCFLLPATSFLAELVVVISIFAAMLFLAPALTAGLGAVSIAIAALLYLCLKRWNSGLGVRLKAVNHEIAKDAMQTFEGVKECKMLVCEDLFVARHSKLQRLIRMAEAEQHFICQIPRFSIEAFVVVAGMGALASLILCGVASGSIVLRLSFIAVAMMRLMPSLSRINYCLSSMRQSLPAFKAIMDDIGALQPPAPPSLPPLSFARSIRLDGVSFQYEGASREVLKSFTLEIPKNSSVAFVGRTGCGKTTLMDVLLGLLEPSSGSVLVDGRDIKENLPSWQLKIGYVPQAIHLLDESLRENVAYGLRREDIDDAKVRKCLETAQLWSFVESLPAGLDATLGERGVRISGGQRQRIGIARALYRDPEVLALDEATSALDNETEKAFVDALKALKGKLTIVMIAHRLSTVQGCDRIVDLSA